MVSVYIRDARGSYREVLVEELVYRFVYCRLAFTQRQLHQIVLAGQRELEFRNERLLTLKEAS